MFTNLKLLNLPANGECDLLEIGRINIICGKNNSGKSTLLRAIANKDIRSIGKQLSNSDINSILDGTARDLGLRRDEKHIRYGEIDSYRKVLIAARNERNVWFSNEGDEFAKEVSEYFEEQFYNHRFSAVHVAHAFHGCFRDNMKTVLLPPKRNLEINRDISPHAKSKTNPDGTGILNNLFYSKSQPEASEARTFYKKLSDAFFNISSG